jgi:hypothetical protein
MPLYQGNGYPGNAQLSIPNICLPNGSYVLKVQDSAGNGINAPGGYVLRMADGRRIIDNSGNGSFSYQSTVTDGFTLPLGALKTEDNTCDRTDLVPNEVIRITPDPAVSAQFGITNSTSGYELWFFNPNGGYSRRVFVLHANASSQFPAGPERATYFRLNSLATNPIPSDVLLNVRVRPIVANVGGSFGPACRLKVDQQTGTCITTQLDDTPGPRFSCGATGKRVKVPGAASRLYAKPAVRTINGVAQQANYYAWEFSEVGSGYQRLMWSTGSGLYLGQWYTDPLLCGTHTYDVRMKVSFDGGITWCPWGPTCFVEITNTQATPFCTSQGTPMAPGTDRMFQEGEEEADAPEAVFILWPNPNRGDRVNLAIEGLETEETKASVDLHDLFGKRVGAWTIPMSQGSFQHTVDLEHALAKGLYILQVTVGDQVFTKRLVID